MKLATRYQRTNLLVTVLIFLLAGAAFYLLLHRVLIFQVDEDLKIEQHEIQTFATRFNKLPQNVVPVEDQVVRYEQVRAPMSKAIRQTVILKDDIEKDQGKFRQLVFTVKAENNWYRVSVSKSLEGTEGLTHQIGLIALCTIAFMLLVSFLINRLVLRSLWKPFYQTIDRLRSFKLGDKVALLLPVTSIEEFSLLNHTLESATGKAAQDYRLLKEFTENASHELQTPLAIVRSKLDLFIQDETLSEKQSTLIQDAYNAIRRMAHLNQSLLMLAKIEAGQYGERESIDIKTLLEDKLAFFDPLVHDKDLIIKAVLQPVTLLINAPLADMLLNNLLANAINHNHRGGNIKITLDSSGLTFCNTSPNKELAADKLFNRFYKDSADAARTGLGLAIARQVCEVSGYTITYSYQATGIHCFSIRWQ